MNTITFDLRDIMQLVKIEKTGKPNGQPYSSWIEEIDDTPQHGLNLVGDQGIYFMANTKDQERTDTGRYSIAYCEECNPDTMENEDLYDAKREIFGGDDGAQFFPINEILKWLHRGKYQVEIDDEEMRLI